MSKVPEVMPDIVAEQWSAWLDDELPAAELELLIARLAQNPQQRSRLGRYGLIGAALRSVCPAADAQQLSDRVRRALDAEADSPVVTNSLSVSVAPDRRWQANIVPFAAAATVLLTLFVMATVKSPEPVPAVAMRANGAGMFMPAAAVGAERHRTQRFANQTLLSRQRLTDYLVWHGEFTGALAIQAADSRIVNDRSYAAAVRTRFEYPAE